MAGRDEPKASDRKAAIAGTACVASAELRKDLCHERAARLPQQLNQPVQTIVRPPFVLAGDLSETELQAKLEAAIQPVCEALLASYFRKLPDRPVLILMFTTEAAYRRAAEQLFFDRDVSRFGYYKPGRQAILVNLAEGDGALFHELTHVLMDADFPNAPQWLQEGLATLHEAVEFRGAELGAGAGSLKLPAPPETAVAHRPVALGAAGTIDAGAERIRPGRPAPPRTRRFAQSAPFARTPVPNSRRSSGVLVTKTVCRAYSSSSPRPRFAAQRGVGLCFRALLCLFLHHRGVLSPYTTRHCGSEPPRIRAVDERCWRYARSAIGNRWTASFGLGLTTWTVVCGQESWQPLRSCIRQNAGFPRVPEFWELRFMIHLLRKSFTGIEKAVLGFLVAGNFRAI